MLLVATEIRTYGDALSEGRSTGPGWCHVLVYNHFFNWKIQQMNSHKELTEDSCVVDCFALQHFPQNSQMRRFGLFTTEHIVQSVYRRRSETMLYLKDGVQVPVGVMFLSIITSSTGKYNK